MADMAAKGRSRNGNKGATHCLRGHPFDEANTRVSANGHRSCKTCMKVRAKARPSPNDAPRSRISRKETGWDDVRDIPGITYRQFDYWCSRGYVRFARENEGSGHVRALTESELRVIALMVQLVAIGLLPQAAEPVARALAAGEVGLLGRFRIEVAA